MTELRVYGETLDPLILKQLHLSPLSPAMGTRAGQRGSEANFPAEGGGGTKQPNLHLILIMQGGVVTLQELLCVQESRRNTTNLHV